MLGLISLSAAESGSGRLSQPLGLCNLSGQGGGRASGLGMHNVCLDYHQAPMFLPWVLWLVLGAEGQERTEPLISKQWWLKGCVVVVVSGTSGSK